MKKNNKTNNSNDLEKQLSDLIKKHGYDQKGLPKNPLKEKAKEFWIPKEPDGKPTEKDVEQYIKEIKEKVRGSKVDQLNPDKEFFNQVSNIVNGKTSQFGHSSRYDELKHAVGKYKRLDTLKSIQNGDYKEVYKEVLKDVIERDTYVNKPVTLHTLMDKLNELSAKIDKMEAEKAEAPEKKSLLSKFKAFVSKIFSPKSR